MVVYMVVFMVVFMVFYMVICMVVCRNENSEPGYWTQRQSVEPRPRYAHQLVYDEVMDWTGTTGLTAPCSKPIGVAQGCPKTYSVFTVNSTYQMFSKLFDPVDFTSERLYDCSSTAVNHCPVQVQGKHYMFGGNPGGREGKDGRLRCTDKPARYRGLVL